VATLECPFCYEILEVQPPDRLHSAFSVSKPLPSSFHKKIIKKNYKCDNIECKKPFTIFWYAPLEYFNRL
jgi:hypothetical protein